MDGAHYRFRQVLYPVEVAGYMEVTPNSTIPVSRHRFSCVDSICIHEAQEVAGLGTLIIPPPPSNQEKLWMTD